MNATRSAPGTRAMVSFAAMGTSCHVEVVGTRAEQFGAQARIHVDYLETLWSRFLPTSDISRINSSNGQPVCVEPETAQLLRFAIDSWEATGGLFSPFVGHAMHDNGYTRSWPFAGDSEGARRLQAQAKYLPPSTEDPVPLHVNPTIDTVTVRHGVALDVGGVAKGYAADLVVRSLLSAGSEAALVDIGGDISFGRSDDGQPDWEMNVQDPRSPTNNVARFAAADGGIATSSTLKRTWTGRNGTAAHHVMDPRTGRPCCTDLVAVTVGADSCAAAEVLATQLLVLGSEDGPAVAFRFGVDALLIHQDGHVIEVGMWETVAT